MTYSKKKSIEENGNEKHERTAPHPDSYIPVAINRTNEHEDKDISLILDYAFRRLFGANTNLLTLACVGKTKEQLMPEVKAILSETQYEMYLEEYKP